MIFVHIDGEDTKNVVGFECGTRAEFDVRHANDSLWVFIDSDVMKLRVNVGEFLMQPTMFRVIGNNALRKKLNT